MLLEVPLITDKFLPASPVAAVRRERPHAAIFGDIGPVGETIQQIYGPQRLQWLAENTFLYPHQVTSRNLAEHLPHLSQVEVLFCTWGMFEISPAHLEQLPRLSAVFYAAGSVKYFASPLLERGVTVVSSWAANAVPVAEFTLGQILLANKGYFANLAQYRDAAHYLSAFRGRGNYGATISILGVGQVGSKLIELLCPFHMRVVVFDPFLREAEARRLGVEKVDSLGEAFARGDIVSNHIADVPATQGLLRGEHFAALPPHATFINTGRGRTVNHTELLSVFESRPDLTALLDVTDPEPLPADHPLRALPNVHISSHIAGSIGNETERVADIALEEFVAWQAGHPLRYAVTPQMLASMA